MGHSKSFVYFCSESCSHDFIAHFSCNFSITTLVIDSTGLSVIKKATVNAKLSVKINIKFITIKNFEISQ